jgi:hypothetical protein
MEDKVCRAKMKVTDTRKDSLFPPVWEDIELRAVSKDAYDDTGTDENNTFAKWTPSARFSLTITNTQLIGKFNIGDEYYIDFIKCNN